MKKYLLLNVVLLLSVGCGKYVAHSYGATGKDYSAPSLCQAVANCNAAGEKQCFYPQSSDFSCTQSESKLK